MEKKSRKMDPKLFSAKQKHEVRTVVRKYKKYGFTKEVVLEVAAQSGRSRKSLYEALLEYAAKNGLLKQI